MENMNIFKKLSAITAELSTVAKNLEVGVGKSAYKAVGEADVLRAVKPLENKYGVYSYPYSRNIIESGVMENESIDYQTKEKIIKKSLFERIETVYRFINVDNPDEYIDITTYGDGIDSQDKSVGKAMTYADKYALLKAYKIITGDDPDQNPSEDMKAWTPDAKRPEKKKEEKKPITYEAALAFVLKDGPHKDQTLAQVYKADREYINEIGKNGSDEVKEAISVINAKIKEANAKKKVNIDEV